MKETVPIKNTKMDISRMIWYEWDWRVWDMSGMSGIGGYGRVRYERV
jgi:hypothetical protein